jgi:hypothetical protein
MMMSGWRSKGVRFLLLYLYPSSLTREREPRNRNTVQSHVLMMHDIHRDHERSLAFCSLSLSLPDLSDSFGVDSLSEIREALLISSGGGSDDEDHFSCLLTSGLFFPCNVHSSHLPPPRTGSPDFSFLFVSLFFVLSDETGTSLKCITLVTFALKNEL